MLGQSVLTFNIFVLSTLSTLFVCLNNIQTFSLIKTVSMLFTKRTRATNL